MSRRNSISATSASTEPLCATMKDLRDILKLLIVFGTLLFNALLIYYLFWTPFDALLSDETQPYSIAYPYNQIVVYAVDTVVFLLVATSALMLWKVYKTEKLFVYAPLFSLLVLTVLVFTYYRLSKFPDSTSEYVKNGYYYKTEIWLTKSRHTYKRWRSEKPYVDNSNVDNLRYTLDSLSDTNNK